ncbi:hypothetical protein ACE41A_14155 [Bacillus cytotoxicus]|uniref:hypothetical protein n=1 Tax=Bacillus cytotoxicus TaxID=580165 RepID=UPI0035CBFA93
MLSIPRSNKPKLTKADQERFMKRKKEVDEKIKERKEASRKINSIETEVRNFTKKFDEREYNFELKC